MLARDVMTTNVVSVFEWTTVSEIAQLLLERHISGVPVVDENGNLIGLVSEGDLIRRTELGSDQPKSWWLNLLTSESARARDYVKSHGSHARDIMTKNVMTVGEDTPLSEIAILLEEHRIKRVPVVKDGKVVGIVSRSNLLQAFAYSNVRKAAPIEEIRGQVMSELDQLDFVHPTQMNVIVTGDVVEL